MKNVINNLNSILNSVQNNTHIIDLCHGHLNLNLLAKLEMFPKKFKPESNSVKSRAFN